MRIGILVLSLLVAFPAKACDLALALAVDVSGSVDPEEFQIQMDGLAAGLRDGTVSDALIKARAALALVQWTGASRQELSVPWTRIETREDVEKLAQTIETTPRAWRNFSTAIGEALRFTTAEFWAVSECKRKVIDVSGDGVSNEGIDPREMHATLRDETITVNALVIEGAEFDLTGYFWETVITGDGAFVVTANGYQDYPARMRQKLMRETTKQMSLAPDTGETTPSLLAGFTPDDS